MHSHPVTPQQRHTRVHRCPICDGADGDPRGQGKRCSGFTSADGDYSHCSREELAGNINANGAGLFAHRMHGFCHCGQAHGADARTTGTSAIEATYDYTDENGKLLFQVVRKPGKQFRQRKPDGAGGWEWKLNGVRRVPYRLRELAEDDADRTVYIVEGEKDVESLERRGFLAACNPGGAGKWGAIAVVARSVLQGREVVVVADRDDVGRKHALEVADDLRGVVRSIATLTPPAPHKDVSDLLAAGGTLAELLPLEGEEAESISAPGTKADRALAVLRTMPILRSPSGLVHVADDRVVAVPSCEFYEAVQSAWCDSYADETLAASTITRALATIKTDRSLPTTDRVAPPKERPGDAIGNDRTTIVIGVDVECNGDDLTAAIARDGRTYQRAGELVYLAQASSDDAAADARAPIALGSPTVHIMALATLFERSASVARWVKLNAEGEERLALPSSPVVAAVQARGYWPDIPTLVAITESPTMRPDGTLVQTPGYDATTGYYYAPNADFPRVPERPTREQAQASLNLLSDLFVDFPFVDDAARVVPIAALLTLQVRPAIEGSVPFFGFDAATRATGKGLAGSIAVEIATGRAPPLATFPNGRNGQEELEKMLGAYALSGAPVVFFDNVPIGVPFGGAPLEKCLTAPDKVSLRRLGKSETPELPWRAGVFVSGNNLTIADETARRGVVGRMVSTLMRPEERTGFKYPEILQHVRRVRPQLVAAGLTIVRAYVAAGSPDTGTLSLGSFEAWSRLVPRAIVWAGGADVMGARVTVTGDTDEATATFVAILDRLPRLLEGHTAGLSANAILDALYPAPGVHEPPDGWGDLRSALESVTGARTGTRPDTAKLGTYFRGHRDRNVDGKTLVVLGTHARANRWGIR